MRSASCWSGAGPGRRAVVGCGYAGGCRPPRRARGRVCSCGRAPGDIRSGIGQRLHREVRGGEVLAGRAGATRYPALQHHGEVGTEQPRHRRRLGLLREPGPGPDRVGTKDTRAWIDAVRALEDDRIIVQTFVPIPGGGESARQKVRVAPTSAGVVRPPKALLAWDVAVSGGEEGTYVGDDQVVGVGSASQFAGLGWGVVDVRWLRIVGLAEEEVGVGGQVVQRRTRRAVAGVHESVTGGLGPRCVGLGAVLDRATGEPEVLDRDLVPVMERPQLQYVGHESSIRLREEAGEALGQAGRGVDRERARARGVRRTPRRSRR